MMLNDAQLTAFLATADPDRCRHFYENVLGLRVVSDDQFAIAFDCAGISLRIQKVEQLSPHSFTALGWQVNDLRKCVTALSKSGVTFERYPFLEQDELQIWQAPSGTKVAWLKDPDGNLLSLSESGNS
jgi:catechol 2,3-dioxygenase-like lactoylglutathione lyase family enzyme